MELFSRFFKKEPPIYPVPQEKPIDLGQNRLLVSTYLGAEFARLLEEHDSFVTDISTDLQRRQTDVQTIAAYVADREHNKRNYLEIKGGQPNKVIAYLLRLTHPDILIGAQVREYENQYQEIIQKLGTQLGAPPNTSSASFIRDRLSGRKNVALVLLSAEKLDRQTIERLKRELQSAPASGLLIVGLQDQEPMNG